MPRSSEDTLDPEQAWRDAVDAGLVIRSVDPLNAETRIPDLAGGAVMPSRRFYLRDHFAIPKLDGERFRLAVGGLVERPFAVSLSELRNLPCESRVVTLECAGNGRSFFDPPVPGEPWDLGAVSTAEWTGVPLAALLDRAGVQSGATEIVFRGADCGHVADVDSPIRFERSLPVDQCRRRFACLCDERRAAVGGARLSAAADRSRLVCGRIGEVADRDRRHRPRVRGPLSDGQILVRMGQGRPRRARSPSHC